MTTLAVHVFEKLQESSEVSAQILYFLSLSYFELKDYDRAKSAIIRALEKNPDNQKIIVLYRTLEQHNVFANNTQGIHKKNVSFFISKLSLLLQKYSIEDLSLRVQKHVDTK